MLALLNALLPSGTGMFTAEYMSSVFPLMFFDARRCYIGRSSSRVSLYLPALSAAEGS